MLKLNRRGRHLDEPVEISADDPLSKISRYVLLKDQGVGMHEYDDAEDSKQDMFDFAGAKSTPPKVVELTFLHRQISDMLYRHFVEMYGQERVKREVGTGYRYCKVDLIVNRNTPPTEELIFYEIKTCDSPRLSIREALGQILEYAMWPDQNKAVKFVIVTQPCPDQEDEAKKYVANLRAHSNLEIYYQSFDPETGVLSAEM